MNTLCCLVYSLSVLFLSTKDTSVLSLRTITATLAISLLGAISILSLPNRDFNTTVQRIVRTFLRSLLALPAVHLSFRSRTNSGKKLRRRLI